MAGQVTMIQCHINQCAIINNFLNFPWLFARQSTNQTLLLKRSQMSITTGKVKGLVDKCQGNNSLNTFNNTLSNPGKKVYVVPKHICLPQVMTQQKGNVPCVTSQRRGRRKCHLHYCEKFLWLDKGPLVTNRFACTEKQPHNTAYINLYFILQTNTG